MRHGAGRAERLYRRLAWLLLPRQLREEAEAELLEVFRDGDAAARRRGLASRVAFLFRAVADLVVTGVAERRSGMAERPGGRGRWLLDLNAALREIGRSPVAAAGSVFTLGLGLAATVLLLVLVRGVLLAPLEFERPDRLVRLLEETSSGGGFWPSWPNIADWRDEAEVLESVIAADVGTEKPVILGEAAQRVALGRVSRGFFRTLGVTPVAGRDLRDDENRPGAPALALIGEEFWKSSLGGRPLEEIRLELETDRYEVVGVVPAGFRFLGNGNAWLAADVWVPLERAADLGPRGSHGYHTIGRLRDGVGLEEARTSLNALAARMKERYGEETSADAMGVQPLAEAVVADLEGPLRLLLIAAFAVLAVSCLNLGAGLLARGITRQRDLAVRTALGARRGDLIRLQLAHAGLLAVPGAVAGVVLAWAGLEAIRVWAGSAVPRLEGVTLDPAALAIGTGFAFLTALGAGLIPALALSSRPDLAARLRTHESTSEGRGQKVLWDAFVAGQVALTLALLVSSALLTRSLLAALDVDLGYRTEGVLIAAIALPESRYEEGERRVAYYDALLARLRASAGIDAAGLVSIPPDEVFTYIGGTYRPESPEESVWGGIRLVDEGYFETVGIPVHEGSLSRTADAALVDGQLEENLWPGSSPVGGRLESAHLEEPVDVAGRVGSVRMWNQARGVGAYYLHYARAPERLLSMHVVARGPDAGAVSAAIRAAALATDPLAPVEIEPLQARVDASMVDRRLMLAIALGFAASALLLAAAGVHALVSQAAARRRRETGIRLILGAAPVRIRRRVLAHGMRAMLGGVIVGVAMSWAAVQGLRSQLFGISALDPAALGGAVLALLLAAGLAAWMPARRATRVDPVRLLRGE